MQLPNVSVSTSRSPTPLPELASRGDGRTASAVKPQPSYQVSNKTSPVQARSDTAARQQRHSDDTDQADPPANPEIKSQVQQSAERPEEKRRADNSERRKAQASQPSYTGERANRLYQEMGAKNAGKTLDEIV